jgi:hypothetical protein
VAQHTSLNLKRHTRRQLTYLVVALENHLVEQQNESSPGEATMNVAQEDAIREIPSSDEQRQWSSGIPTPSLGQKSRQALIWESTPESQGCSPTIDLCEMLCVDLYECALLAAIDGGHLS